MGATKGIHNLKMDYTETTVAIDGAGAGTEAVVFDSEYLAIPDVFVVQNDADEENGAAYTAASVTNEGFTLTVTGSSRTSRDVAIIWIAHEKD